ncbi:ABC transporter permease [Micromonospora sp. WMMD998]|uniref:ABC transporter permease n=1 Tax=Micromonospora sp. WMMD998 TaxID=3016092 RepID=UPI00249BAE69|nr:ABC transporter permease [Micromonospora sp. WMMD998]WFE40958.1 ABC transporter permease [Micromonospora sp. WMMD998]
MTTSTDPRTAATPLRARTWLPARRSRRAGGSRAVAFWLGGAVVLLVLLAGLFAHWLAPYDPLAIDPANPYAGPSGAHWLGTDANGRDVLSRLMHGSAASFRGIAITVGVAGVVGSLWGLVAGYLGGPVDEILMRLADAVISFPGIVLAIAITGALGPSLVTAMLSVGVVFAPVVARLLRAQVLALRQAEFVLVARSLGVSGWRIAVRHVLPNAMGPVVVQLCGLASTALIIEAALGFLGLGVQPPAPSWGPDLARAYADFYVTPLLTVAPGLLITVTAFAISQFGDGLRDRLRIG